ncbi:hypothetical protein ADICEAN_02398 [Cesiribacter andamanensis AMV16]|uniref:Uncharacterized protein n=1 Tax=Cesiribacter andamanensis AMV16 TaxID=1279009 RepID=M7N593_9BACT|nr:hypothetical protein ADICEAN_02398 [Cesiribacter andamanensis AMV16]
MCSNYTYTANFAESCAISKKRYEGYIGLWSLIYRLEILFFKDSLKIRGAFKK